TGDQHAAKRSADSAQLKQPDHSAARIAARFAFFVLIFPLRQWPLSLTTLPSHWRSPHFSRSLPLTRSADGFARARGQRLVPGAAGSVPPERTDIGKSLADIADGDARDTRGRPSGRHPVPRRGLWSPTHMAASVSPRLGSPCFNCRMVIFGFGPGKQEDLGEVAPAVCPNCHNQVFLRHVRSKKRFSLYFVPVVPYGTDDYQVCPICSRGLQLSTTQLPYIRSMSGATASFRTG